MLTFGPILKSVMPVAHLEPGRQASRFDYHLIETIYGPSLALDYGRELGSRLDHNKAMPRKSRDRNFQIISDLLTLQRFATWNKIGSSRHNSYLSSQRIHGHTVFHDIEVQTSPFGNIVQ
jgi:hypothetical protein